MPTLTAIIMRHARAAEPRPPAPDFERPLVASGGEEAALVAEWLQRTQPRPARVLCSSARRTRQTAEVIAGAWAAPAPPIEALPGLYLAELPTLLETLATVGAGPVVLVGHNPGLEDLVDYLLPRGSGHTPRDVGLPTAGVCVIDLELDTDGVPRGRGILRARTSPADLTRA